MDGKATPPWELWSGGSWEWSLHVAAQHGQALFINISKTAVCNARGWSPVMYASAAGEREALKTLLGKRSPKEARRQAVATAVHYENSQILAYLAQDELVSKNELSSGLLLATTLGKPEVVRELIRRDANPYVTNEAGETALEIACRLEYKEIVSMLVIAALPTQRSGKGVQGFCEQLVLALEAYHSGDALRSFLEIADLHELLAVFEREEIDFGVCLQLVDSDLRSIGVQSVLTRRKFMKQITQVNKYLENIFGKKVAKKLF